MEVEAASQEVEVVPASPLQEVVPSRDLLLVRVLFRGGFLVPKPASPGPRIVPRTAGPGTSRQFFRGILIETLHQERTTGADFLREGFPVRPRSQYDLVERNGADHFLMSQ